MEILIALQFVTMHKQVGIQHAFMEMHHMLSIKLENPFAQWSFLCRFYRLKRKENQPTKGYSQQLITAQQFRYVYFDNHPFHN